MANITLLGASYTDVPAIDLPQTGGGVVRFYENGGGSTVKSGNFTVDTNRTGVTIETGVSGVRRLIIVPHVLPYETAYSRCMGMWFVDFEKNIMLTSFGASSAAATPSQAYFYDLSTAAVTVTNNSGTVAFSGFVAARAGTYQAGVQYDWYAFT